MADSNINRSFVAKLQKLNIMANDILFTRDTFLAAMRREKKRKQEWEERMNKKLDDLQEKIKLANDSHIYDLT